MDRILYKGAKEIKESDMTLCFVVCPRRSVRSAMWKKRGMWTRRRFGRSGWDKTMRKGRGQGEIENIGGEVKLGYNQVEDAKKNLMKFYNNMVKNPAFMCIVFGICPAIIKDPETGIYIVPITALKP